MSAAYRIEEKAMRVHVDDGFEQKSVSFGALASSRSNAIVDGSHVKDNHWDLIPPERRLAYAVARDELLERGLIEDESEAE